MTTPGEMNRGPGRSGWRGAAGMAVMLAGLVVMGIGLSYVGLYIHGVFEVLHQPDRSWIFWGLTILLIGLALTVGGAAAMVWGRSLRHRSG